MVRSSDVGRGLRVASKDMNRRTLQQEPRVVEEATPDGQVMVAF